MTNYERILSFARNMRKNPTKAEAFFWSKVRNRRFDGQKINRQFVIQHGGYGMKESFFIADFHCHQHKLIIELDGDIHLQQIEYDEIREDILRVLGFRIIRFKNEEVLENWNTVQKRLQAMMKDS